ncbi:methyltransferase domain-containing protein [Streptosporangium sp. CA-135522]|uniref:class I SAM-dependent methyltransferase n=1 Tax=Streptosporangium sp. CA-135522 TaxID=3240072 RepID=UPI003D949DB2
MTEAPAQVAETHWNDVGIDYDKVLNTDASNVALLSAAVALLPADVKDLLDVGSGTGRLTKLCRDALPGARIVGVDPAPTMVQAAREKFAADPDVSFADGVVEDLSLFPDNSFDAVISSFALHHLELDVYATAAAELFRVLRPGGRFVNADQFCRVMGPVASQERALDILDLLTAKARHYLEHACFERMLLQVDLLPRFMREDGEILTTPEYWGDRLTEAGFEQVTIVSTPPAELYNRVVWAVKPAR